MPNTARIGDSISHGGKIIMGSENYLVDGIGIARIGDQCQCSIHGLVTIITGSPTKLNGVNVARVGDLISCGATIITGSATEITD